MASYRDNTLNISDFSSDGENNSGIVNIVDELSDALLDETQDARNTASVNIQNNSVLTPAKLQVSASMVQQTVEEIRFTNPEHNNAKRFDAVRHSLRSNKGCVTRWMSTLEVHIVNMERDKANAADKSNAKQLIDKIWAKNEERYEQLDELARITADVRDDTENKKDEYHAEYNNMYARAVAAMAKHDERMKAIAQEAAADLQIGNL